MLELSVPFGTRFMPYIVDVLKMLALVLTTEALTANALGAPISNIFDAALAQKILFNFLGFSVFHLLVLQNISIKFADDKEDGSA